MDKEKVVNKNLKADKTKQAPTLPLINPIGSFYTNAARITYNQYEYYLDLIQFPAKDNGQADSLRIYLNPTNFKQFTKLFVDMLKKYEDQFGSIKI